MGPSLPLALGLLLARKTLTPRCAVSLEGRPRMCPYADRNRPDVSALDAALVHQMITWPSCGTIQPMTIGVVKD